MGKSLLINTSERLKRVSVTDPAIADMKSVTPTQILVHGRAAGEVSLLIWDELERSRSFDLRVDVDVTAAAEEEKNVFPDEQIVVTPSRSAIVLSGHVSDESVAKRAGNDRRGLLEKCSQCADLWPHRRARSPAEVKFAEVDRSRSNPATASIFSRPARAIPSAPSRPASSGALDRQHTTTALPTLRDNTSSQLSDDQ